MAYRSNFVLYYSASQQQQIKHYALEKHDSEIFLSKTAWLTNTIIVASQSVLIPANRFQQVGVGQTLMFKIRTGEFIQFLHCCSGNWLTVSTVAAQHLAKVFACCVIRPMSFSKLLPYYVATSSNESHLTTLMFRCSQEHMVVGCLLSSWFPDQL